MQRGAGLCVANLDSLLIPLAPVEDVVCRQWFPQTSVVAGVHACMSNLARMRSA